MTAAHDTQALTLEDMKVAIRAAYDAAMTSLFSGPNDPDAAASAALAHLTAALASRLQEKEGQPALSDELVEALVEKLYGRYLSPTCDASRKAAVRSAFAVFAGGGV